MGQSVLIHDLPEQERPREKLAAHGADALGNPELIAILLRTGTKGVSAITIAHELLKRFQSLENLAKAPLEELQKTKGVGRDKAIALKSAFTLALRMARELRNEAPLLDIPERIAELVREETRLEQVERLLVLLVNTRRRLILVDRLSQGTLDSLLVHPREVFRTAISANAAGIVLAHNHPSGDPTPSDSDIKVTRDLIRAGQLLKIEVLDHIIIGRATRERSKDYISLRELGYFYA